MRRIVILSGLLCLLIAGSTDARTLQRSTVQVEPDRQEQLLEFDLGDAPLSAFADTVWMGGSGLGDGSIVRGGVWDWEADSGETPEFFFDGDPVGNQYRDGFRFMDLTSVGRLSQLYCGHWTYDPGSGDQVYDFDDDLGAFAHRATVHDNDGINDGPDPLQGNWSVWVGTNLYLNPEICGWHNTAGHGDGWSQGIMKQYTLSGSTGSPVSIEFFQRYAVEAGFDTCWVETSFDGQFWDQVGDATNPNGIFNGGDKANPLPSAAGSAASVQLGAWPGGTHDLWVRFRVSTDALYSDETEGGIQFYTWQLDDVRLRMGGTEVDFTDFESGMNGWEPARFEGFDFDVTLETERAAGRVVPMTELLCPLQIPCPEACGLEGNVLIFCDKDDCNLHDEFQHSYAVSPAFSIGGPENPDIDGVAGRIVQTDVYWDGGTGLFETGLYIEFMYWPYNVNQCPYTPTGGAPGSGESFNWSRQVNDEYVNFGAGAACVDDWLYDISDRVPAEADSMILAIGAISQCRSEVTCDPVDAGTPFYDNARFGVYDPEGSSVTNDSFNQYCDSYPMAEQTHAGLDPLTARSDGSHNFPSNLGIEIPLRYVRADTALVESLAPNAACYLRWRADAGPCQDLSNPFWSTYPPGVWHEARMAIGEAQGTGQPQTGTYMTCFHEDEVMNGTSWGGEMTALEPCDDILPDGVFSAGTQVYYFFEVRGETSGDIMGTAPAARRFAPIDTTANYARLWREFEVLPELLPPGQGNCDPVNPLDRANTMLFINDQEGDDDNPGLARQRMLAFLDSFGLDYDIYDVVGTRWGNSFNGIGRREDRPTQQPRPPLNGATQAQLEGYNVIWYISDWLDNGTLSDQMTTSVFGGHPTNDQQKLENWIAGCTTGENRLLIADGYGWASDIDVNTTHGSDFLTGLGVDVLDSDYESMTGDLRRCARITGNPGVSTVDGEIWGSGCPNGIPVDVIATVASGELVANYVNSLENGTDPVDCSDDQNAPGWAAVVRSASGTGNCQRSVAMSFSFIRLFPLKCVDECLFNEWSISKGLSDPSIQTIANSPAQMISDMFAWAGHPIGAPIGVEDPGGSPALHTRLIGARPNPANPSATITFSLAQTGNVSLKVFDVSGRLVRTLIDGAMESSPEAFEVVWDGTTDAGQHVGSGVFFYQLQAPGYTSSKKLVILK